MTSTEKAKRFLPSSFPAAWDEGLLKNIRPLLIAALAFALFASLAAVAVFVRTGQAEQLVTHSFQVREVASSLLRDLLNAETGQRGYLITNDEKYLAPYEASQTLIPQSFDRLRALTTDNPNQQQRLSALRPIVDTRLEVLQRTIQLAKAGQREAAAGVVMSGRGKALMDEIRARLDAFAREESELLARREAAFATLRNWLIALGALSLTTAIGLGTVLAASTQFYIDRLRERTNELEIEASRRQEVEATLRQAQKIEAIGQLTGGIAHDFNNLLTIIIGNLDTIRFRLTSPPHSLDDSGLNAKMLRSLDFAMQGARSAAQLTSRLLTFSRRQTLSPGAVDLNRLISGMSELLRRTLGEAIEIETVLAGGLWPALADAHQLENCLLNLAINSRDAMPDGGKLTIETANASLDEAYVRRFGDVVSGQYVLLSVTDTGTGIAPEVLERVFEPFFTTKSSGEGTGLGLAMVHGFVKQSGGHVRIYSEVGHGTTVKIYLPRLAQVEVASAPAPGTPTDATGVSRAKPAESILLVEDNDGVRNYARAALEDLGYAVLEASDAHEALRIINGDARIDLLFTDVVLTGGQSGRDLANQAAKSRPALPVLFTTGYTRNAIVHHGRLDPGVQLLSKPYAQQDLARKIREVIDAKPGA